MKPESVLLKGILNYPTKPTKRVFKVFSISNESQEKLNQ